jgi:hypothetical protein
MWTAGATRRRSIPHHSHSSPKNSETKPVCVSTAHRRRLCSIVLKGSSVFPGMCRLIPASGTSRTGVPIPYSSAKYHFPLVGNQVESPGTKRLCDACHPIRKNPEPLKDRGFSWCLEPESNQRHMDFQSIALPTELSRPELLGYLDPLPFQVRSGRGWGILDDSE